MKWVLKAPEKGDIIRVSIGEFYHFGLYVSDEEIIQFGLPPVNRGMLLSPDVKVLASDMEAFLAGGFLEVGQMSLGERLKARRPDEAIRIARSRIGEGGYNLIHNNCEHFVNECVFGEKKSETVDAVRRAVSGK